MADKKLTEKNKRAIEVYLGAGSKEAKGNGTKAWQEVYGTKSADTAGAAWARMLGNVSAQRYLEELRQEAAVEVKERISYEIEDALRVLIAVQEDAMETRIGEGLNGEPLDLGMRDRKAAIQAAVEALKVQGKYVTKSENTTQQATAEDRMMAAHYGYSLSEFLERQASGTLPDAPEVPKTTH